MSLAQGNDPGFHWTPLATQGVSYPVTFVATDPNTLMPAQKKPIMVGVEQTTPDCSTARASAVEI